MKTAITATAATVTTIGAYLLSPALGAMAVLVSPIAGGVVGARVSKGQGLKARIGKTAAGSAIGFAMTFGGLGLTQAMTGDLQQQMAATARLEAVKQEQKAAEQKAAAEAEKAAADAEEKARAKESAEELAFRQRQLSMQGVVDRQLDKCDRDWLPSTCAKMRADYAAMGYEVN